GRRNDDCTLRNDGQTHSHRASTGARAAHLACSRLKSTITVAGQPPMEREYELFEKLPDGSPMWRGHASGLNSVRQQLQQIARETKNECFAIYLPTKEIVARLNVGASVGISGKPLVFQIAYDTRLATARTDVLRLH